jgi:hypothetical protein
MSDIPSTLRAAREAAGLTPEDIASRTKIKVQFIRAIDLGAFDQLPGEFFTRGFLKMYAKEVGLSPQYVAAEFDAQRTPPVQEFEPDLPPVAVSRQQPFRAAMPPGLGLGHGRSPLVGAALTVLLLVGVFMISRPGEEPGTPGAVGTGGVAQAAEPPAPAPVPEPETLPGKLTLDVHPTAPTWLTVTTDDQRLFSRLVQTGEHVSVEGQHVLALRIGNAGGFEYSINGVPGKPLGVSGEVRDVRITPENYRTFRR